MAVKVDLEALRDVVAPSLLSTAEDWLADGRIGDITGSGGGASATVAEVVVWVGVVDKAFTAECDCTDDDHPYDDAADRDAEGEDLCPHAVALIIAATESGFAWSAAAIPPSQADVDPEVSRFIRIAASIPRRRLAALVGEFAAEDRRLATRLLAAGGRLGAPDDAELTALSETIDDIATAATEGQWDLEDLTRAGHRIVNELEILEQRPPTDGALAVVEHAARLWDELAVHLHEAYGDWSLSSSIDDDLVEINDALRAVHVGMCERLDVDPDDLARRLIEIIRSAEVSSCLDAPNDYRTMLGRDLAATVARRR